MRDYIVAGVPLRDPQKQWWIDYRASSLGSEVSRSIPGDQPYGYHGDPSSREGFFSTSRDTLVLIIVGNNKDDFNAMYRGFQGLFDRPELSVVSAPQRSGLSGGTARNGQTFSVTTDIQRIATIRKVGSIAREYIDEAASRLTIILENRLAFWSSFLQYTAPTLVVSAPASIMDLQATLADSQAPVGDGLIRIKGPISIGGYVQVCDRDTPRNVKYTAVTALGSTEYIVIDMAKLTARLQTTDTWASTTGTDVGNRLSSSGGGVMSFTPGAVVSFPTQNDYWATVVASGHTNGSTAVEVRARRSYLS